MKKVLALGLLSTIAAAPSFATNGYFTHGIGTHSKAMAGAGDSMPTMSIDAANNPASGVLVGEKLDVGIAVFSPRRSYETTQSQLNGQMGAFSLDAGKVDSGSEWFPIPYVAKNWKLDETSALTVSFYGRGGMNSDYTDGSATFDPDGPGPAPIMSLQGTFGTGTAGVNLNQAYLELAYSFKVGDVSLGFAPVLVYQMFSAEGVGAFAPYTKTFASTGGAAMPLGLTNNGSDSSLGYGAKVGAIWNVSERFAVSAAYQSKMAMEEFSDYSDLFAEQGDFDIPAQAKVGVSYVLSPRTKVHFDIEHTYYKDVNSVANALTNVAGCPTAGQGGTNLENCLGGNQGFGFGWDDVTVYQLGAEWMPESMEGITLRAGYSYGEQPISAENATINILAPATVEQHFTAGFSMDRDNGDQMSIAVMYAPEKSVSGPNLFDPTQEVTLSMSQFEVEFAYSF